MCGGVWTSNLILSRKASVKLSRFIRRPDYVVVLTHSNLRELRNKLESAESLSEETWPTGLDQTCLAWPKREDCPEFA